MYKTLLASAMVAGATALASTALIAAESPDAYPSHTITFVVPFPPGSTSDIIPRMLGPHVAKALDATVVVENRPGANGSLGAAKVATSPPDGYHVLLATTGVLAINPWVYSKLTYDPAKDFDPVINAAYTPNLLIAHPSISANNLQELVELARQQPGQLNFASAGNGSTSHLCGESLKAAADIDMVHVPYQGPAVAIQDVLGGRVALMCDNFSNVIQHVKAGRLKAIALTATERSALAPEIPTSVESGYPDVLAGNWYSFVVPAGTPRPIIDKLNKQLADALHQPDVRERLETLGLTIIADSPDHFRAFIADESARLRDIVEKAGARLD